MPKLVACPALGCGGANFADFRFCQWCGIARKVIALTNSLAIPVNDEGIIARRLILVKAISQKSHSIAKDKEFEAFEIFLRSRSLGLRRRDVFQAIPLDVVDFIIFRDLSGEGRTKVHKLDCMTRSSAGCDCPVGLSAESIRGLASKLKTRFYELGSCGAWNAVAGSGNPADSGLVSLIVLAMKEEQARAGVHIMSARRRALLPDKLNLLVCKLTEKANKVYALAFQRGKQFQEAPDLSPFLRILQDLAWFTIQFRALNRGSEIQNLRVQDTIFGPNLCCAIFQFGFSKVMRTGQSHEFGVQKRDGDLTCPVKHFLKYINVSKTMFSWDWKIDGAFVFDSFNKHGERTGSPVSANAMNQRFQTYLKEFGMDDSATKGVLESLHGLRAGGALELALEGASLADIMVQGFWKSPQTALHYIGLLSRVIGDEFLEDIQKTKSGWVVPEITSVEEGEFRRPFQI
jgi:hypothetical protein